MKDLLQMIQQFKDPWDFSAKAKLYCVCPMCKKQYESSTIATTGRGLTPDKRFRRYCDTCSYRIKHSRLDGRL